MKWIISSLKTKYDLLTYKYFIKMYYFQNPSQPANSLTEGANCQPKFLKVLGIITEDIFDF